MKVILENRKAKYTFHILDKFLAGIVLKGEEVKSIRSNKSSFGDAYCYEDNGEIFIKNYHISSSDPLRNRKLLLNKNEIRKIKKMLYQGRYTIVPLKVLTNQYIKIEIALCTGKNKQDKRVTIKKRELNKLVKKAYF